MSKAWRTSCVVLALLTLSTMLCSRAKPSAPGEIERLIAQVEAEDPEVVFQTDVPPYNKHYYSPEMERLIEIGKPAVPLLVQRLQELQGRKHVEAPLWDIGDVIVAMLGDIGDPAATEAIVAYARQWHRWEETWYNGFHMEALG